MAGRRGDHRCVSIPECAEWTEEQVGEWIKSLGLPQYKECFTSNLISGRKLILVDASTLPRLGVQDWTHIKTITSELRKILQQDEPYWNKSISVEPRNSLGMELEDRSRTKGKSSKY